MKGSFESAKMGDYHTKPQEKLPAKGWHHTLPMLSGGGRLPPHMIAAKGNVNKAFLK